jgi:hypothetical protein
MKAQNVGKSQLMQNPFLSIFHDPDSALVILVWSKETASMADTDFKEGLTRTAEFAEQYRPHGLLVNVENFKFGAAMGPELSQWRIENIIPRYNKAGLKKFAFVHGSGFPEKSGDGEKTAPEQFLTKHFASEERAKEWASS